MPSKQTSKFLVTRYECSIGRCIVSASKRFGFKNFCPSSALSPPLFLFMALSFLKKCKYLHLLIFMMGKPNDLAPEKQA